MPLHRFRDVDEARRALWLSPGDPKIAQRIRALWAFSRRLVPGAFPRGVRKYRSIETANADRDQWVRDRIERLSALRRRGEDAP